mmetsp:Transcript_16229/g.33344  ORF Transcript_16229/g.33344 Transcript_16229/m.33344 type:complete len:172 (-) Transcript_16229:4-519(-)
MSETPSGSIEVPPYPQNAQLCFSSLRRGGDGEGSMGVGGAVICPEGYEWCIKETVDNMGESMDATKRFSCGNYPGLNMYFGDTWDEESKLCTYRKCGRQEECAGHKVDTDPASTSYMTDGDLTYTRNRYCCNTKPGFRGVPCNAGVGSFESGQIRMALLLVLITITLLLIH